MTFDSPVARADGGGAAETTHGCVLAIDADRRYILVPRAPVPKDSHLTVASNGVELQHARPSNLAALAVQTTRDLMATAKETPLDASIHVHALGQAT